MLRFLLLCCLALGGAGLAWADAALFEQLEARAGKGLALEQRFQVSKAVKAYDDLAREREGRLVGEVVRLTGLPAAQVLHLTRLEGSLVPKVEATLKRRLPDHQLRQLREAEENRRVTVQAAREALAARLGAIAGVSPQTVIEILPRFGL